MLTHPNIAFFIKHVSKNKSTFSIWFECMKISNFGNSMGNAAPLHIVSLQFVQQTLLNISGCCFSIILVFSEKNVLKSAFRFCFGVFVNSVVDLNKCSSFSSFESSVHSVWEMQWCLFGVKWLKISLYWEAKEPSIRRRNTKLYCFKLKSHRA